MMEGTWSWRYEWNET